MLVVKNLAFQMPLIVLNNHKNTLTGFFIWVKKMLESQMIQAFFTFQAIKTQSQWFGQFYHF